MTMRLLALRWHQLLTHTWRGLVAVVVMAAGLHGLGLAWSHAADTRGAVTALLIAVPTGSVIYGVVLAVLWLAARRPIGAERDIALFVFRAFLRAIATLTQQWRLVRAAITART